MKKGPGFLDEPDLPKPGHDDGATQAASAEHAVPVATQPDPEPPLPVPPPETAPDSAVQAQLTGPRFLDEAPAPASPKEAAGSEPRPPGWLETGGTREGPIVHDAGVYPSPAVPAGSGALIQGIVALLLLMFGVAILEMANFIAAQFARALWLGILTLAVLGPMFLFLLWSLHKEWRGYVALEDAERYRQDLASQDKALVQARAAEWLERAGLRPLDPAVVAAAKDAETIRGLLRAGPLVEVERKTSEAGRAAAFQVLAATAVSPWPGLDGVIVVWRGMRLVREVAQIHGVRPGTMGTIRLFRRVTMDAGLVAASDVTVTAVTEAVFNSPMGGALAGQATGAAMAARRVLRLAYAVSQGCRPL